MRILIIGCGSIGTQIARAVDEMEEFDKVYITDQSHMCAVHLQRILRNVEYVEHDDETMNNLAKELDLVVEAASQAAARHYAPFFLGRGVDTMVMSVGVFADDELRERCFNLSKEKNARLYVPSGAVCGTDGLRAASIGRIDEVTLITRKGRKGMCEESKLRERGVSMESLAEPCVIFEGTAREAALAFPRNMNVSGTLSLLGVGFDDTRVKIICDPDIESNQHTVIVKGEFGELRAETKNVPSPKTPSTSFLAALSAVAAIKRIASNIWIGI
ncbi:MAG: aspartate dehydrogenase [Methanomassiliicoccales archaeon]|nr:aspartate dehydrogenase [Methanomassiliicoccales archaeon]NYT14371.1 aspartate dehydrogenase [Methanomassiliicoccales archaeon]